MLEKIDSVRYLQEAEELEKILTQAKDLPLYFQSSLCDFLELLGLLYKMKFRYSAHSKMSMIYTSLKKYYKNTLTVVF
jgi:hypothetical protein